MVGYFQILPNINIDNVTRIKYIDCMKLKDILKELGFVMADIKNFSIFVNEELTKDINTDLNIHSEFRMEIGEWMFVNGAVQSHRLIMGLDDDIWIRIRIGKQKDLCCVFMAN